MIIPLFTIYSNYGDLYSLIMMPSIGLGNIVGIVTRYGLDGPGIESQ
jgi:hypothetical protein